MSHTEVPSSKDDDRRYYQHPSHYTDNEDDQPSPTVRSKHAKVPFFKDTPVAISAINDDRRYYQPPSYYTDNEDDQPSPTVRSKHAKVPFFKDTPVAISAINDDRRYYQPPSYYASNDDVQPTPTIESTYFTDSLDFGPIPQDSDYESKSVAGRSEGSTGSKDSGYESARPVRVLVHRRPQPRSADISRYYHPPGLRRLQESSDIDLIGTPGPLQEHREGSLASSVRAVYGKETKKTSR